MEHRSLGRSGLKVPVLSLGAMTFGESRTFMQGVTSDDDEARRVLDRAIDAGMAFVDTANIYSEGRSEELLGRWLEGRRDRVLLGTKCRFPVAAADRAPGPNEYGLSRKAVVEACEASLRRLRTDFVDLYQVHMQDRAVPVEETLRALDDLVRAGKARYVGCSNYTGYRLVESLWAADRRNLEPFASVQLQWSLACRDAEREVVPACRAFGLGILVWSPLARGFLTGKYERDRPAPEGSRLAAWTDSYRTLSANAVAWRALGAVRAVAARLGATPAAVAIAWLLRRPEVSSVVVGARTVAQLDQNLGAIDVRLSDADTRELDEASRPDWGYPYAFIGAREPW